MRGSLFRAGSLLWASIALGCSEPPVVSKFKPPPFTGVTIELPEQVWGEPIPVGSPPIELSIGKPLQIQGKLAGVRSLDRKVGAAMVYLSPRGHRQTVYASCLLRVEFLDDDTLRYFGTVEPLSRTGEMDLVTRFNLQDAHVFPVLVTQ